ncbi:WWP1 [Symbiodinium sp. CCMP2592]|nr:WWP1 [Symbiodinium sp. CCMP2592]
MKPHGVAPRDWFGQRGQGRVQRRARGEYGPLNPPQVIPARPPAPASGARVPADTAPAATTDASSGAPLSADAAGVADSSRGTESPAPAGSAAQAAESASSADPGGSAEAGVGVCTPPTTIAPSSDEEEAPAASSSAPKPDEPAEEWPFRKLANIRRTEQLPYGWTKVMLEDGHAYCFHSKAKVCCWHVPQVMDGLPDAEPLPPGFEPWELWDQWGSSRTLRHWFNPVTGSVAAYHVFAELYERKKAEMEEAEMKRRREVQEARDAAAEEALRGKRRKRK